MHRKIGRTAKIDLTKIDMEYLKRFTDAENFYAGWTVVVDGVRSGVVYLSYYNGNYYLDAYKDPNVKTPIKVSLLVGKTVLEMVNIRPLFCCFFENSWIERIIKRLKFEFFKREQGKVAYVYG